MKRFSPTRTAALALLCLLTPSLAHAHVGVGPMGGFLAGFSHPVGGLDHLCAMVAVGLWAAQLGQRAIWMVPLAFVSLMAAGGAMGMVRMEIPFAEQGIMLSVLALGALIAAAARPPLAASVFTVGLFAIFHGHAHGAEAPETASGLAYAAGFVLATAGLHAFGIGAGLLFKKVSKPELVRVAGATIGVFGGYLWLASST